MKNNFFHSLLQNSGSRIASAMPASRYLLDKNEQAADVDPAIKQQVVEALLNTNWNRYPASDYRDIEAKVADYCGLEPKNVVLSAGSASIITTLLDFFALNKKQLHITQPSYSLFDYHCKTYNIPYQPWHLTEDLKFDLDNLPRLDHNSVFIITAPNNPVGNNIGYDELESILQANPETLIILDGVYTEFSRTDFTPLVQEYSNLIVLRSFSKAFPVAGLRLGYLCAAPEVAAMIRKLILQFSITPFSLIFARDILFNPEFQRNARQRVREIIRERNRMYRAINELADGDLVHAYPSEGNFLLVQVTDSKAFEALLSDLSGRGIRVLNTSGFPLLANTFRVSVGSREENEAFLQCLTDSVFAQTSLYIPMAV